MCCESMNQFSNIAKTLATDITCIYYILCIQHSELRGFTEGFQEGGKINVKWLFTVKNRFTHEL